MVNLKIYGRTINLLRVQKAYEGSKNMSEFYLSAKGLMNCANTNLSDNFMFIVGKKEYPCNSFLADFISPKVSDLHIQNPLAESLKIDVNDPYDVFSVVMQLMNGEEIDVIPFQIKYIRRIAKALGNQELIREFSLLWKNEALNLNNVVQILEEKFENNEDITTEIDFIASNFFQISPDQLDGMDIQLFDKVFSSPKLILEEEPKTFNFIYQQVQKYGPEYISLFKYIIFENTKKEDIQLFLDNIPKENISKEIFDAIKMRLSQPLSNPAPEESSRYQNPPLELLYDPSKGLFHGVFKKLFTIYGENLVKTGIVSLKPKNESSQTPIENIFKDSPGNDKKNTYNMSVTKDNYILIDFKTMQVQVTGYSIGSGLQWNQQMSWVLEGKNNPREDAFYTVIDEKKQNADIRGPDKSHYWECVKSKPYQYIRWRLTQGNGGGINFKRIELYGILIQKPK